MTKHVFLSYCSDNSHQAQALHNLLIEAGEKVWWDQTFLAGQDRKGETQRAMDEAFAVVCCISEDTQKRISSGFHEELRQAIEIQRKMGPGSIFLIPVRFSPCEIPAFAIDSRLPLEGLQHLDFFEDTDWPAQVTRLTQALAAAPLRPP